MRRTVLTWLFVVGTTTAWCDEPAAGRFQFTQTEMAVPIKIVLYAPDEAAASEAARAGFARFHALNAVCSDYDSESELRKLCRDSSPGRPIGVSDDLWRVLARARELSERSGGAFDVTIGPVVRLWRSARRTKEMPSSDSLQRARSLVGYNLLRLDPEHHTVELLKSNMRLDLGGIAKGYAVDEAMRVLRQHGISRMMIEAGGNIGLGDPPPGKAGWRIGVAPPDTRSQPREYLELAQCAVSTSGDTWQYAIIGGTRYSHLIDPRTGRALTEHCSVTVVGPDGLGTDGLSSAVTILGPEKGMKLINDTPGAAAIMIRIVDGKEDVVQSKHWAQLSRPGT
jgi:thiamine biosynthesis lipoprotein